MARRNQVVPPGIDPAGATMIITWRETLSYLLRTGFSAGRSLLVIGSGGVGLSFVAHAAALGASGVGTIGNAKREELARAAGATDYFDYKAQDLEAAVNTACPDGYDSIIDAVGKSGLLDAALPFVRDGGTVGIYGIDDYGACAINPSRARGSFTYSERHYDEAETHDQVINCIQQGKLEAGLFLDLGNPFPLERINDAFEAVAQRKVVKALVELSQDRQ